MDQLHAAERLYFSRIVTAASHPGVPGILLSVEALTLCVSSTWSSSLLSECTSCSYSVPVRVAIQVCSRVLLVCSASI